MKNLLLLLLSATLFASCVRKEYDAPPDTRGYDPNLPVNMTIAELKSSFAGPSPKLIDSNWTIYGIVTADDRSGNLYKLLNIEDSTGDITIRLENNNLYGDFPVGRKVYVKLKGLYIGFDNNWKQLGAQVNTQGDLTNIPTAAISDHIIKASFPHEITPQKFTDLSQFGTANDALVSRLVELENVEFIAADTNKTYAQPATLASGTDLRIEDCFGNTVIVRTSAYANFQAFPVPKGRGTLRALYTVYRSTPQLLIIDTADVDLYGPRCGSGPTPTLPEISIDSLRRRFKGSATTLGLTQITGTVISNRLRENIDPRNLVLQQGERGIVVRFSEQHNFNAGDSLVINASGQSLSEFNELLQVTGTLFKTEKATRVATGRTVTPKTLTIAQIVGAGFENYESTLVRIQNATASGGATYVVNNQNTSHTLNDNSGQTIVLYTDRDATFSGAALPTGPKTWVGIIGQFNSSKQFSIRDTTDVQ